MRLAVALSKRGYPAPNPRVGCVIAKAGGIVGQGWHRFAGGPHAEVEALQAVGDGAKGATAYVTLEPCNHTGRTGPCSEALIEAGIAKVVVACRDPNPKAHGGLARLQEAGVEVESGLCRKLAAEANRVWLTAMSLGRPLVAVKAAVSLDGRIALPSGESQWITGERARREAHKLRAELGTVLVGRATVENDDPLLTARFKDARNQPVRVVLDPERKISDWARMLHGPGVARRIVKPGLEKSPEDLAIPCKEDRFDLRALLAELWVMGVVGLLVEGGGSTISRFFEAGLVDRVDLFLAPKVLGSGPVWVDGLSLSSLRDAFLLQEVAFRALGDDVYISGWRTVLPAEPA